MRTFAKILTDEEIVERQLALLAQCRERETYYHNLVRDKADLLERSMNQLAMAKQEEIAAVRLWEDAKRDLANVESTVQK